MGNNYKVKHIIEVIEKDGSAHHLFNYHEVRAKIISLFGEPKTDKEFSILDNRCIQCMNNMPCFILNKDKHQEYEIKLRNAIKGNTRLVSIMKSKLDKTRSTYQKKVNNLKEQLRLSNERFASLKPTVALASYRGKF